MLFQPHVFQDIPTSFSETWIKLDRSEIVTLYDTHNRIWEIRLEHRFDRFHFKTGWKKILRYHSLTQWGYSLSNSYL